MPGLGTILNCLGILSGGGVGLIFGKFIKENIQDALTKCCGICTLFIGISGALEGMLRIEDGQLVSEGVLLLIGCMAIGTLLGELLGIEEGFAQFGTWLKNKTGNAKDSRFVDAFVTASVTVCIGAMAIVGSLQDGLLGDYTTLAAKSVLDLIIIMVMTCAMGKGCIFSAIPVALLQGTVTAASGLLKPVMTPAALDNLSTVGSVLIFCVGINLVFDRKLRVANMLPAVVIAVIAAFLPF